MVGKAKHIEQYQDRIARLYEDFTEADTVNGIKKLTRNVTFVVTSECNLRCKYCYEIHKGKEYMTFDVAKKFIDLLLSGEKGFKNYIDPTFSRGIILEFIGGEPLLAIDLIDQIVDYFKLRAIELMHPWAETFMISICSNGVMYFDERVQKFLEKNKERMSFSVTIDGNKELHDSCRVFPDGVTGSYDKAVAAARDWMDRGYYMGSKITIAPTNLPYLKDAILHMVGLGYDEINANCVYEEGWTVDHAKEFYKQLIEVADYWLDNNLVESHYLSLFEEGFFRPKDENDLQTWCGGTGDMLAVDWNGKLYPCLRYTEMSLGTEREPIVIGDVDNGLAQRECEKSCIECMRKINRRTKMTDECFYCPIAEGCSECSAYNYQVNGTMDSHVTYICVMHKARALANCYFWNAFHRRRGDSQRMKLYIPKEWAMEIVTEDVYNKLLEMSLN